MAGHAFPKLGPEAEAIAQFQCCENAGFNAELHRRNVGANILRLARAFPVDRRTDREAARADYGEAERLVRRLEFERFISPRPVNADEGAKVVGIGARIAGVDLRTERYSVTMVRFACLLSGNGRG